MFSHKFSMESVLILFVNNIYYRALRISHAQTLNYYAVLSSEIQPLPHQIQAVYNNMLTRSPLRFLLADDPGAGKTIMTGLLIQELLVRNALTSCIIIAPGPLAEQWQDELASKFHIHFGIFPDDFESDSPFWIARLDTIARSKDLQQQLFSLSSTWDLAVIDEAHKLSAHVAANETHYTKRFRLGQQLSAAAKNFLLLTATPHNGIPQDYMQFISLLSENTASRHFRRLLKENLLTFDCSHLFPEREAFTASYSLSPSEYALYEHVTEYVSTQFNLAERLDTRHKYSVGFAMTILQKRLASSPEAIYQSLTRRLDKLRKQLAESSPNARLAGYYAEDFDDEEEQDIDTPASYVSASGSISELQKEIRTLNALVDEAHNVRISGQDTKWQQLSHILQTDSLISHNGQTQKLIIFTEYRDTLNYLADKITSLTGRNDSVITIHGELSRSERHAAESTFMHDTNARILIATDAAGEGINLQCSHLMINYDLPWNPNRLEQRFGRIHRIGQENICYLWNLVAHNTREGSVFERLLLKLNEESKALGGQVFDVLGKLSINGQPLHELILDAVRGKDTPSLPESLTAGLLDQRSKNSSTLTHAQVLTIKNALASDSANRVHPKFIEAFFLEAFRTLGGSLFERGKGCYEIMRVPPEIRRRDSRIREQYHRICFDRNITNAEIILQGHPLLNALVSAILERFSDADTVDSENSTPEGRKAIESAAMCAVMRIERALGNTPVDVSRENLGYDIESHTPEGALRLIEVKGRRKGAATVTLTVNEIHSALQNPSESILALVEVDGDNTHTQYLQHSFTNHPDDAAVSVTFSIAALVRNSVCVYTK